MKWSSTNNHWSRLSICLLLLLLYAPDFTSAALLRDQEMAGGTISGEVTDESRLPLSRVSIFLDGTTRGAISDEKGRFTIRGLEAGLYHIRASSVGYYEVSRSIRVVSDSLQRIDLVLRVRILESEELVVTASRREEFAGNVAQSLVVLGSRDLDVRNIIHLKDALRYVSGVHIQDNQVNIRGSSGFAFNTGSRALLLLDGMPLLTPDTDGVPFDMLPFSQIDRVEVIKGAGSALYGSGSLGGTINVITSGFPEKPGTRIRLFTSAYEPVRYTVWKDKWDGADRVRFRSGLSLSHARRTSRKFGYWFDLAYRKDEGYLNFNTERVFYGYGKIGWRPSTTVNLDVLLGVMDRKKDNFLFWNGARDVLNPGTLAFGETSAVGATSSSETPTGTNDVVNNQITLLPSLTHVLSEKLFYAVKGRFYGMAIRPINNDTGKTESIDKGTLGFRVGGEIQVNYEASSTRYFTAGISADALATESDFFVTSTGENVGSQPETAVFVQLEESSFYQIKITAGLRYDAYRVDKSRTESSLSPRFNIAWHAGDHITIRAAYGHGFRVPSLAERYTDNRDFLPVVRNLELKPEQSRTFEAGIRVTSRGQSGSDITLDAALFRSDYSKLIEPRLVPTLQAFQFVNLTDARISGVETTITWVSRNPRLIVRAGYTYLDSEDQLTGMPLPFRSKHLLIFGGDVVIKGPFSAGADIRYTSKPERVDSDFALFVPDADQLIDTRLLDLRASIESGPWLVRLLLKNATDYYYIERPALFGAPRRLELQIGLTM